MRFARFGSVACLVSLAAVCVAPPAHADPKACADEANHGADDRAAHHFLAARDHYALCADPECPGVVRDECSAALSELANDTPSLRISVVDEQQRVVEHAAVMVDDRTTELGAEPIPVDPGPHHVRVQRGWIHSDLDVVVKEGELERSVQFVLAEPRTAPPAPSKDSVSALRRHTVDLPKPAPPWPVYVLGGVGAVSAGSFGYFALRGHALMSDLDRCKPYCAEADLQQVRSKYLLADISLGVSLVALGSAAYLWFTNKQNPAGDAAVALDVRVSHQSAVLGVRWAQ